MGRKTLILAVVTAIAVAGIFFKTNFAPTEDELLQRYLGISVIEKTVPDPSLAAEMPYPVPVLIISLFGKQAAFSPEWFRLPNYLVTLAFLALLYAAVKNSGTGKTAVIMAVITPWLLFEGLFDLPATLTLTLAVGLYLAEKISSEKVRWTAEAVIMGLLTLTSAGGGGFGLIFLVWKAFKDKSGKFKPAGISLLTLILLAGCWFTQLKQDRNWFFNNENISLPAESELVDQHVRYEYKINDYRNIIPLPVKRLVYNKYYFAYRDITEQAGKVLDWEKWSFPGQAATTVAKSLWASKGLGWITFWQLVLAIWASKKLKSREKEIGWLFLSWAAVMMFLSSGSNFLSAGLGIVVPLAIWSAAGVNEINWKKWWPAGILAVWGGTAFIYHFAANEVYWRSNRPMAFMQMAESGKKYGNDKPTQITTILGRTFLYYAWITRQPADKLWTGVATGKIDQVTFNHFDLKNQKSDKQIYIGFPGEFLGSKELDNSFSARQLPGEYKLLYSFQTHDTLSFGNGDYIWTVEVNK
jgi:hypothetical protein